MPQRAIQFDSEKLCWVWSVELVEESDVTTTPGPDLVPRSEAGGTLALGWMPSLTIDKLPVAADGVNDPEKVVRANDSRLSNPPVGGDISGTAAAATVIKIRNRTVAATAPTDGQGLVWNNAASQWEPGTVSGSGSSLTVSDGITTVNNVTQINVDSVTDEGSGEVSIAAGSGGGEVPPGLQLFLLRNYW